MHHIYQVERLRAAYMACKRNAAAGVDGQTWANAIKLSGPAIILHCDPNLNSGVFHHMENIQNLCQYSRKSREFSAFA
jgi:hypothetical protein